LTQKGEKWLDTLALADAVRNAMVGYREEPMNNSTSSPPDPGCKLTGWVEDNPASALAFYLQKLLVFLRRYWWGPVISLTLAVSAAVAYVLWIPPTYVSTGRLYEAEHLRLPEGAFFADDSQNYLDNQAALLRSEMLSQMAYNRLLSAGTKAVPLDREGNPLKVKLKINQEPKSSILVVEAGGSDAAFTRAFLDALMNEYIVYKKNVRLVVSGDTLASISEQVQRLERDMKADQDAFMVFKRTNNLNLLQAQGTVAMDCLAKLNTQLSDLQLEELLLKNLSSSQTDSALCQTIQLKMEHCRNSIKEWEVKVVDVSARIAEADSLKSNIARTQSLYDRLVNLLNNVDISRNIQQSTLVVLEPASPAKRTYTAEKRLLGLAGIGGLSLGLGIIVLMELYRGLHRSPPNPNPQLARSEIKPGAAERLEQIKRLFEKDLLSKEAYDRKVEQIVNSL
jgi:uncharacterized protein involved in exopolysaccharide biosynthesis